MGSEASTDYCTNAMFTWKSTAGMGGAMSVLLFRFSAWMGTNSPIVRYCIHPVRYPSNNLNLVTRAYWLACVVLVVAINPAIYTFLVFVLLLIAYYYYTTTPPPSLSLCLFWVRANLGLSSTLSHRPCQSISMGETQQS